MANNPLKFTAITDLYIYVSTPTSVVYEFSKDGVNWQQHDMELAAGEICFARGNDSPNRRFIFQIEGEFTLSGSLSSLVDNGVGGPITLQTGQNFCAFFCQQEGLKSISSDLLSNIYWEEEVVEVFAQLFEGCSGLTEIPSGLLPRTTLCNFCYQHMFYQCSNLAQIPADLLPATTLTTNCYNAMFGYCPKLESIPSGFLPATSLDKQCYYAMFTNTGIISLPEGLFPATIMAESCYDSIFQECFKLTSIPNNLLPSTELARYCYAYMFSYCTSLPSIPENFLPALELKQGCYNYMFEGCHSLTATPKNFIAATEFPNKASCLSYLFYDCPNLKEIYVNFIDWGPRAAHTDWVKNVAAKGNFYCPAELPIQFGTHYIPSGWTVNPVYRNCFYIKNTGDEPITIANHPFNGGASWGLDYSINNTVDWIVDIQTENIVLNPGDKVYFKGTKTFSTTEDFAVDWFRLGSVRNLKAVELGGSITSLVHNGDGDNKELVKDPLGRYYTFNGMFQPYYYDPPKTGHYNIDNLELSPILAPYFMYASMFSYCGYIDSIPENFLPKALAPHCYYAMFAGTHLTKVPETLLPKGTPIDWCYAQMFTGNSNLNEITVPFSSWGGSDGEVFTENWLYGVAKTGTFRCPSKLPLIYDDSHIPVGWKVEYTDKVPEHRTITLNGKLKTPFNKWANLKPGG